MIKKWDLETLNAETELKIGIYAKNWAKQVLLKNFDQVKVNGQSQWSTVKSQWPESTVNCWRVLTWRGWRHLGLTWQEVTQQQARVARGWEWPSAWWRVAGSDGAWRCVAARGARVREAETSGGAWGHVWGSFWPFLVGFCSGLDVLSFYACYLVVECTERWYPSVVVLWAWRRWLASDSGDWMKARAAEERRRCPLEPENQRNGSDTMLTI